MHWCSLFCVWHSEWWSGVNKLRTTALKHPITSTSWATVCEGKREKKWQHIILHLISRISTPNGSTRTRWMCALGAVCVCVCVHIKVFAFQINWNSGAINATSMIYERNHLSRNEIQGAIFDFAQIVSNSTDARRKFIAWKRMRRAVTHFYFRFLLFYSRVYV